MNKAKLKLTKEQLEEVYVKEQRSMKECSEVLGVSVGTVYNYIKKYGIESRPQMTENVKLKISVTNTGKPSKLKGRKLSDATKAKISQSHTDKFVKPSEFGGHRKIRNDGYVQVYCPKHPMATKNGYVMEHILIMEKAICRYITRDEVVHHRNHNRSDNRIENLELMTFKAHAALHMKERWENQKEAIK